MRFGSGRSRREIAVALGVPESTIMGRLARAMRLVRREVGEEW
jgi:DNA-directed RNA polymerase specialized sigma24 family protein